MKISKASIVHKNKTKIQIKCLNPVFVFVFILFALFTFTYGYAILWTLLSSLKDFKEYFFSGKFLPQNWLFSNYVEAFSLLQVDGKNLFVMMFNAIWITIVTTVPGMFVCAATAYVFSKYEFAGKKVMHAIVILQMMIPLYGSMASTMKFYINAGFYDSPLIMFAHIGGLGGTYLVFRSYFDGVSWEYAEAAKIDGANEWQVFLKVMLPQAMPAILSMLLLALITGWNDYSTSIYYMPSYPTIASGLYLYQKVSQYNLNYPVYFAGLILSCVPTMILFFVFQDRIMKSISMGGLKG